MEYTNVVGILSEYSDGIPANKCFRYDSVNINVKPDTYEVKKTHIKCIIGCELKSIPFLQVIKSSTNISADMYYLP